MKATILSLVILLLGSPSAFADQFFNYTISNLTFVGNAVCGPSLDSVCEETVNSSFEVQQPTGSDAFGSIDVPGKGYFSYAGDLGYFYEANVPGGSIDGNEQYIPLGGIGGASFQNDIWFPLNQPGTYTVGGGHDPGFEMYSCLQQPCKYEFLPPTSFYQTYGCYIDCAQVVSGTLTISDASEPASLPLLLLGLGCAVIPWRVERRAPSLSADSSTL